MASLKIQSEQPERLILVKGGSYGSLIGVLIFGVVTFAALSGLFEDGFSLNPVAIIILFVIGVAMLGNIANAISATRVVLDSGLGTATRTDTLFFFPIRRTELAVNLIRDVQVTRSAGSGNFPLDSLPIWQVQLQATDGAKLIVNEKGTRAAMDSLAHKVGTLLSRPVRDSQTNVSRPDTAPSTTLTTQPSNNPTTAYTPTTVVSSLYENLLAFAQSPTLVPSADEGFANVSPPIVAPTIATLGDRQENAERTRRRRERKRSDPSRVTPANTFTPAPPSIDPNTPYQQVSDTLSAEQFAFSSANQWSTDSVAYTAPPVLVMPNLPPMTSFGPALNMPSFPPLGGSMPSPQADLGRNAPVSGSPEIKEVQAIVTSVTAPTNMPNDARDQYRTARNFFSVRNFRDAQAGYLRALSTNPADPFIQNDLGVTYLEQNKLRDAESAFRRAVALDPFFSAARYNLGIALHRLGKRSDSLEQFNVGIQNAYNSDAPIFRDAQRGILRTPLPSPAP